VTVLFVTHDQEEALSLSDEIAVMMDGKILQTDTPHNIYRHPATHQVATFLGEANFIPGRAGRQSVECELGRLPTDQDYEGEVEVMFRPEDLSCVADEHGRAVIEDLEYFGHDQLIQVRLDSGTLLRSRQVGGSGGFVVGRRVRIQVECPVVCYPSRYGCPIRPAPREAAV
jgi:iron(III) transport system ATP-binding protein